MTVICVVSLIAVVIWEWRHEASHNRFAFVQKRSFAIGNMLMFMVGFALLSSTVLLPQFSQELLGYTAQRAGLALMPGGIAIILCMPLVGYLLGHTDARRLLLFGLAMVSFSLFHMTQFRHLD